MPTHLQSRSAWEHAGGGREGVTEGRRGREGDGGARDDRGRSGAARGERAPLDHGSSGVNDFPPFFGPTASWARSEWASLDHGPRGVCAIAGVCETGGESGRELGMTERSAAARSSCNRSLTAGRLEGKDAGVDAVCECCCYKRRMRVGNDNATKKTNFDPTDLVDTPNSHHK